MGQVKLYIYMPTHKCNLFPFHPVTLEPIPSLGLTINSNVTSIPPQDTVVPITFNNMATNTVHSYRARNPRKYNHYIFARECLVTRRKT
jgi:hypothetical protein